MRKVKKKAAAPPPPAADSVVVVGASAGGIEALSTVLGSLDARFPAPIVVAQHIDPGRRSYLQEVLQRKTGMNVVSVAGRTRLTRGTVFIAPPHSDIVVLDGAADVRTGAEGRSQPSVDVLLESAARAYGEHVVAVILSGNGSDGSSGAVEVKHAGGTVIIQDPRTAPHPSMPRALPPTAVDHVADVEGIGPLLRDLMTRSGVARADEPEVAGQLDRIVRLLGERANIDFRNYKTSTVLRRVERRMIAVHAATIDDYTRYLATHPQEVVTLVKALLIKVTKFFRDPEAFRILRETVLPAIIERARTQGRRLRLWSAGCATGEEAYSLAILVADLLGPEMPEWSVRIFATDLDDGAVAFARRGNYPPAILENVADEHRERYFERVDGGAWRVNKDLRQLVIYGQQDLSRGVPFPRLDLVVCRNLLIYFTPEVQQELLDLFAYSLHDTGGFLFLGRAETARPSSATFELLDKKWKIYRCLNGPLSLRRPGMSGGRGAMRLATDLPALGATGTAAAAAPETPPAKRLDELIFRSMQVGTVVIDREYRTVSLNPTARRLLGFRDSGLDRDFLHTVRGLPYEQMRSAIDTVFREQSPVTLDELPLDPAETPNARFVTLAISPMGQESSTPEHVVITVVDATEPARTRRRLEAADSAHAKLVEELSASNRRLNDSNKDLQDANEQLQASNEELMLAQEELQATNEEFEATNEELQATNEELETNNEELQATNEELETTNEELHARTAELSEISSIHTAERDRLIEVLRKAPCHVLVLDGRALVVESFNPLFALMGGFESVNGRSVEEVFAAMPSVLAGIKECLEKNAVWSSEPQAVGISRSGAGPRQRVLSFTAVPLHVDGKQSGVAVYADPLDLPAPSPPADPPPARERKR